MPFERLLMEFALVRINWEQLLAIVPIINMGVVLYGRFGDPVSTCADALRSRWQHHKWRATARPALMSCGTVLEEGKGPALGMGKTQSTQRPGSEDPGPGVEPKRRGLQSQHGP